jgi:hypothetical protein
MSKPVTKSQFDTMLERRVNIVARALKDQIGTTENNPQYLEAEAAEKAIEFLENAVQALKTHFQLVLTRPQPITITEFTLKPKAPAKNGAATKAKKTPPADLDREALDKVRDLGTVETPIPEEPVIAPVVPVKPATKPAGLSAKAVTPKPAPKPVTKPAEDDDLDELDKLDELLGDE